MSETYLPQVGVTSALQKKGPWAGSHVLKMNHHSFCVQNYLQYNKDFLLKR
uniref:Uncharacterized protein n=1 Tax=Zea mays TaxID=4577 RepID=C4J2D0_MAIZE|nr:unknown [Zea mays]